MSWNLQRSDERRCPDFLVRLRREAHVLFPRRNSFRPTNELVPLQQYPLCERQARLVAAPAEITVILLLLY